MATKDKADKLAKELLKKHPLQRIQSPGRSVSAIVHAAGLISFASSYKYLVDHPNAINSAFGWHFQYLTILGLTAATVTFSLGLVADMTLSPTLFQCKNAITVASAPLEVLISMLYWGLQAIDPSLVMPDWLEPLPLETDLGFHAAPAVFLLFDILFLSPPWTISVLPALGLSSFIAVGYWFWVEQCYSYNGFYPYPIFNVSTPLRGGLFVGSAITTTASTMTMKWLYTKINGHQASGRMKRA